jgi:hypothetical protein
MKKQGFNPYLPSWEYIPDEAIAKAISDRLNGAIK